MGDLVRMRPHDRHDAAAPEPLWRELAGRVLRRRRRDREQTLADVAERAGISTQYLSEVERGRKEPSSEVLGAVTGALDLTLLDLTLAVSRDLHDAQRADRHPVRTGGRVRGPLALAA